MIQLHLMGGLGNQMSQVAFGYFLAKRDGHRLQVEATSYKTYKRRPCSIQKMQLDEIITVERELHGLSFKCTRLIQECYHVINRILAPRKELPTFIKKAFMKFGHVYSCDSNYIDIPCQKGNVDIYGYYLIEPYFHDIYDDICRIFKVKEEFLSAETIAMAKTIENSTNPIAISLRLQKDYTEDPVMCVCTTNYFLNGIKILREKFPESTFFIFADDINEAKKIDLGIDGTYVEGVSDVEGMHLMQRCNHFVISNSSFSWWGAYLSRNKDKIVIAPDRWINNKKDYSAKYYPNVIKIGPK